MDVWRIILAIAQVAAAAKHEKVVFNRGESAPMARFHGIGQVFPDALYRHIVVTFDVALLRQEIKELQEGISYRRQRAPSEHRGLYDLLEENLVAGNQELEDDMDFFTTSERKERTFGELIAGVLELWNVVQIHEVKRMVEGTKKGLMIEVHHVDVLKTYPEATRKDLGRLAERILQQTNFLWSKREQISSKAAVGDALKQITEISKIATTITDHKLDRAVMDLVNVPKIFSEYTERLEEEGWYIELDGWQDIFHLEASYHASAATLTVAVRIPLLRRGS
jgi:archaellum component FlaC